ncbi:MAG: hypothetical protein QM296_00370 [Bacillota bacterium]|nr:hypothetical protein [Bacillota bacterium]
MKKKLSVSLGLLGLVTALAVVPAQAKAYNGQEKTAANAVQTLENTQQRRKVQAGSQQQSAARKTSERNSRARGTMGTNGGSGEFCTNDSCPQDPANCVPALDGTGRQNGTGTARGANATDCPNPDGTRTPKRDGTGNPRR